MGRPVLKEQHVRSANIPRLSQVDEAKVHSVSTRALLREEDLPRKGFGMAHPRGCRAPVGQGGEYGPVVGGGKLVDLEQL